MVPLMNISNKNNINPMKLSNKTGKTELLNSFQEVSIIPRKGYLKKTINRQNTVFLRVTAICKDIIIPLIKCNLSKNPELVK